MARYQLLIFDWDGTIVDSEAQIVGTMQAAIAELALPPRADDDIKVLIGLGLSEVLQRLYPELDQDDLWKLYESYRRRFIGHAVTEARLFPGAFEALTTLRDAGYRLAIATGKSRRGLDRSLEHHAELRTLFSSSRCADEAASKPHPLMLQQLLEHERLGVHDALMIGDTEYDMQMAAALGMPALGVACGVHDGGRLLQSGARALLEDLRALPAWLGAQGSG